MSKRRFIVPAFFVFDLNEDEFPEGSECEVYDAMQREADYHAEGSQGIANEWLSNCDQPHSGLLLDDSPTFEVDADSDEWPHSLYDMWRRKLVED